MEQVYYWIGFIVFWVCVVFCILCAIYFFPERLYRIQIRKQFIYYCGYNIIWNPIFMNDNGEVKDFRQHPRIKAYTIKKTLGLYIVYLRKDLKKKGYYTVN